VNQFKPYAEGDHSGQYLKKKKLRGILVWKILEKLLKRAEQITEIHSSVESQTFAGNEASGIACYKSFCQTLKTLVGLELFGHCGILLSFMGLNVRLCIPSTLVALFVMSE